MPLRGALRKKISEKEPQTSLRPHLKGAPQAPRQKKAEASFPNLERPERLVKVEPVEIIHSRGKVDWILDILTGVFAIGVIVNAGFNVGNLFQQNPAFEAMQSYLLFAILFQLVKFGRKI